jgi:NADH-quinone oxidoreductase subunit J
VSGAFIVFFALLAVAFAAQVLSQQQPMRAALSLVGHMVSLAAIYACLGAHVVAVFQILIYVGAVMVFMVYTIMLLDERDRSYRQPFSRLGVPALLVAILVAAAFWSLLGDLPATAPAAAAATDLFSFTAFSLAFMKQYWFHFELATVLLLTGILAAWTALREGRDG